MSTMTQYFDSNAPDNGDGTIERPLNTSEAFNQFLKEDGDRTLYLKAGSTFHRTVPFLTGKGAIHVLAYGEGEAPMIRGEVSEITTTYHINSAA